MFSLNDDGVNYKRHSIGFLIYFIIFVVAIPYFFIKNKHWNILTAYFPNLDLIASVLGYHGGPNDTYIWTHLYNPADSTYIGYITSNIINFFALLGVTYIIAHYTFITKDIYKGWSRVFIMLPMTYFIPSNYIIYYMNSLGIYLNKNLSNIFLNDSLNDVIQYLLVLLFGFLLAIMFIFSESLIIKKLASTMPSH